MAGVRNPRVRVTNPRVRVINPRVRVTNPSVRVINPRVRALCHTAVMMTSRCHSMTSGYACHNDGFILFFSLVSET